jgi:hypothetical protein
VIGASEEEEAKGRLRSVVQKLVVSIEAARSGARSKFMDCNYARLC